MKEIRIGLVGAGWMGKAHTVAFQNVVLTFGTEPAVPVLECVCARTEAQAREAAQALGFRRWTTDWRQLVSDPAVDVVDIATPNAAHLEIALGAIAAGKHVYCEKPLAPNAADAVRIAEAAERAGVVTLVGFNYLHNPSHAFARDLVVKGEIGEVTAFRASFDQDVMTDPSVPFSWRMDRKTAGSGALGDMGSHAISLALDLVGPIESVCGMTETFVKERPVAAGGSGYAARGGEGRRPVENEDAAQFLAEFANGALGYFTTSRVGTGRKLSLTFELQGTKGALVYDQERMNELQFFRGSEPRVERGYKLVYSGPDHGAYAAFHPIPGVAISYSDQKIIEARELVEAIAQGRPAHPDFRFGATVSRVVDAVLRSAAERRWIRVADIG